MSDDTSVLNRRTNSLQKVAEVFLAIALIAGLAILVHWYRAPVLFVSANVVDFGILEEGQVATREITLRNDGRSALIISDIQRSCGCTKVDVGDRVLEPSMETKLSIEMVGGGHDQGGNVLLASNDRDELYKIVMVTAQGGNAIDFVPSRFDFGEKNADDLPVQMLGRVVFNQPELLANINEAVVSVDNPYVNLMTTAEGRRSLKVAATIIRSAPSGVLTGYVSISEPSGRSTRAKLYAEVVGEYVSDPMFVSLGAGVSQCDVIIRNRGHVEAKKGPIQIHRVSESIKDLINLDIKDGAAFTIRRSGRSVQLPAEGYVLVGIQDGSASSEQVFLPVDLRPLK